MCGSKYKAKEMKQVGRAWLGGGGKANSTNSVSENLSVFSWINMNILSMFWGPWPFLKIINRFGKFARIGSLDSDTQERVQKKQKAQQKTEDD